MSNFKQLKDVILGCATRAPESFQSGTTNFVDVAINNAVIFAQRQHDFEWNKGEVSIECNPRGLITSAIDEDSQQPVQLKRIIKAFGENKPTGVLDVSFPYLSRVSQVGDNTKAQLNHSPVYEGWPRVIHQGQTIYLTPIPTANPHKLYFEAVKWLPRLCRDCDSNFLFHYAFDFLMYRSIVELNFFLKEDERFNVTKTMLEESWRSVVNWDTSLVSATETEIEL